MIARLSRLGPEQRKLILSLGVNFATRIPGAFGVLLILPLLRFDLGTTDYAYLMGALALGASTTFLFGGFNTMGRRLIGEAYSRGEAVSEADGFMSMMIVNAMVFGAIMIVIGGYALTQERALSLFVIAGLVGLGSFANTLDNVRAAYNEHYVTAILQIVFQVALLGSAIFYEPIRQNPILASIVVQGHGLLASLVAGTLLLKKRPHLLRGRPRQLGYVLRNGIAVGMADGLLAASLSFSVVWVQAKGTADLAAWYATVVRLFQTILVPVVLLLMPLSSYVRLGWADRHARQQVRIIIATVGGGIVYGAVASAALAIAARYYVEDLLHLPGPHAFLIELPIYVLFATTIAYRSYSSIAYLVTDGAKMARWITAGILLSIAVAAVVSTQIPVIATIALFGALVSVALIACELRSVAAFGRQAV